MEESQLIKEIITNAPQIMKEPPHPLRKSKREPKKFPIDSLPPILQDAILGIHDKIQAPLAICAQSVLATLNLAVQGHANVMLPYGNATLSQGQIRPISCFFMTIAESGERKTSCDNEVMQSVFDFEKELNAKYQAQYQSWQNHFNAWDHKYKLLMKSHKGSVTNCKAELDQLGESPAPPLHPLLVCPEPTFEGLCKLLMHGQPSIGVFSNEGGQFIGGHGMKEENKLKTAAALSSVWDGEPIKRVRSGDGISILNGRRVCMHLMVQPQVASKFLSDATLKDQGLLSRILVSHPTSAIGNRFTHPIRNESIKAINLLNTKLSNILSLPLPVSNTCINELHPRIIGPDKTTTELLHNFSNDIETRMKSGHEFEYIKGLANKLPEHAMRLASTIALIEDINTDILTFEHLKAGIEIALYYADEAVRLFDEGTVDHNILLAEKSLTWMHNTWHENYVSLPDIYQRCCNAIKTKAQAMQIVSILENHGWLKKVEGGKIINNCKRKEVWEIINKPQF